MPNIGKIKFSNVKNNRGVKTDHFRIAYNAKEQNGDWKTMKGCEELTQMPFYFPFKKMENNIRIVYSGFVNLPTGGVGSAKASYSVTSKGIDEPLIAIPIGHDGKFYDGRDDSITLTQERLNSWPTVKKRMTVYMTPAKCSPNEYAVWHTTSEIAISAFTQDYMNIVGMIGENLSLIPLTFKAIGKSGKSSTNINYRFFYGSLGSSLSLSDFADGITRAKELRKVFNIDSIESAFEADNYFNEDLEDDTKVPEGFVEKIDTESGEVTYINPDTKEELKAPETTIDYGDLLMGYCSEAQAKKIVSLALAHGLEKDIQKVSSPSASLVLLNKLQNLENSKIAA